MKKIALVFPGQGSQSVGMMNHYGDPATLRRTFEEASEALGRDLWHLIADGMPDVLSQTVNTQPIMLAAGVAVYREWVERGGIEPSIVAGHSLGEYTALVAAGALTFREALPLVQFRAHAMQDAVPAGVGAMAAVVGLDEEAVRKLCAAAARGQVIDPANFNAPDQIVVAGHAAAVVRAMEAAKASGAKRAVMLNVSAPFHCALMAPAAERLKARLARIEVRPPQIPVLQNVDVRPYAESALIKDALVRQAHSPVRWVETVRAMVEQGVTHIYECGPGKVLWPLCKRMYGSLIGGTLVDHSTLDAAIAETR